MKVKEGSLDKKKKKVLKLHSQGMQYKYIAEEVGMSLDWVYRNTPTNRNNLWSQEEINLLLEYADVRSIKSFEHLFPNKSREQIRAKRCGMRRKFGITKQIRSIIKKQNTQQ